MTIVGLVLKIAKLSARYAVATTNDYPKRLKRLRWMLGFTRPPQLLQYAKINAHAMP